MDLKDRTKWVIDYISKKEGISNNKIGDRLGFTNDTINSYRSKLANPKVDFIIKFCDEFDIDLIWFTKGDGEPFPGATMHYPEVCNESRYEQQTKSGYTQSLSPNGSLHPIYSCSKSKYTEDSLTINSAEKSLLKLCKLIGIPTNRGWKTVLARYFGSTPAQLSNCISRNRISKKLIIKIEKKGYSLGNWLIRTPEGKGLMDIHPERLNAEMSFQQLSLLAGIKIGPNWILELADLLGIEPWNISMNISYGRISPDILNLIEAKGYRVEKWAVFQRSENLETSGKGSHYNNTEILNLAEKILKSNTIHAASLAMNIISLNHAVDFEMTSVNKKL